MLWAISIFSYLLIFSLLAALAYRDLKEYILPDSLNATLALAFLSFHIITQWHVIAPMESLWGGVMGGGLLLLIRTIANKFYKADSLGLGDVKLMAAAGLGLGQPHILVALIIGSGMGLLHGLCIGYADRKTNKRKMSLDQVNVPAGLGLTVGVAMVTLYQFGFEWLKTK
ncbi:MAG: prepilin peptidase [Proteobacteria bacterium]|nr:prepilin peptidase [Pseudomonadota bacterium]